MTGVTDTPLQSGYNNSVSDSVVFSANTPPVPRDKDKDVKLSAQAGDLPDIYISMTAVTDTPLTSGYNNSVSDSVVFSANTPPVPRNKDKDVKLSAQAGDLPDTYISMTGVTDTPLTSGYNNSVSD
ncbi:hypothetical protein PoB_004289900 [Plakobranchus ocellatus]|uniref:Uncharacterized protein n=1 Tax=Plakobranchus ocellatus TaxID=259542 RepID=A0AAV4BDG0_9GAST|nr:hypothetical protein PoB_004289900 [Plakobranchus ocellatus]